jgi:chromosome segregation ATPase
MPLFGRRDLVEPATIDAELDRLRAIRISADEELGRLRKELAERVANVERKERELADALAKVSRGAVGRIPPGADEALVHAQVGLAARNQELNRRERELTAREREFVKAEAQLAHRAAEAAKTPQDMLDRIEARARARGAEPRGGRARRARRAHPPARAADARGGRGQELRRRAANARAPRRRGPPSGLTARSAPTLDLSGR